MAAAIGGDAAAITTLWRRHRRWIASVLLLHKPQFEDLEDLLQEVAMTLVTRIHTLREESNIRAWLRTVAINAARAAARSGRCRPWVSSPARQAIDAGFAAADHAADAGPEQDEHLQMTLARLQQLPEAYREPLVLRAVHGLRSREIAEILDIPPATVDTRVSRGRRMLLEDLRDRHGRDPARGPAGGTAGTIEPD